ncbi:bifunctional homocysteine S-methyltransferase/methylenetetrahydrofolate reductase [Sporolactobacillus inulinus]|uniref:Homocysteine methyltransferase n=1 Tax=Sporolactobacillus inulinus CASD TaxID=1069536 RepID=A0A0U1QQS9_9BACL|nr:bifunctional homocysteine S-methyltransferase/methylenetetrahydrofolate reductase [Sporolactobacillus inulinus]KLI03170.1 homocysteine methyltransferase [Sporolactobacillus inulinus CASD]GEB76653.1 bifunctional homocysteine S-methyltransferase/5,10-methylenetetrahydrofolate reductase [Sporolactobacillus inulinus]
MGQSILDVLKERILIGDGAMGTLLYSYGIDRCFEELNVSQSEAVRHVHQAYINAGADVIQTNSYGANRIKLARYGLEHEVARFNRASVQLAKQAAKPETFVLGTIGGIRGFQKQSVELDTIRASFREQADALLSEGIDALLLETYYDFDELRDVLQIARTMTDLPIITHVSMQEPGVLQNGMPVAEALEGLEAQGADVVGTNCRLGPFHMIEALRGIPLPKKAFLSAYPNSSLPDYRDGKLHYENEPEYFKKYAVEFRNEGVRLLGGCCGTTPVQIKAFKEGISALEPLETKVVTVHPEVVHVSEAAEPPESALYQKSVNGRSVFVEFDTPRHLNTDHFFRGVQALEAAGADAITMADNSLASPRISNAAIGKLIKDRYHMPPLVHLTCRDRNLIGLQSHLLGLDVLGLHDLLVITGDPTKIGDFPGATSVYDVSSMELIKLIKQFNRGISYSGKSLKKPTHFRVAAAFNPNVRNLDRAVQRLKRKIECGADYFISQPVFDKERIIAISEATRGVSAPIYIGIMPLTSARNAEFLHNEVPGIRLPDDVRAKMAATSGKEEARQMSFAICRELIDTAMAHFRGIYLITPMGHYSMSVDLVKYIKKKEREYAALENSENILL